VEVKHNKYNFISIIDLSKYQNMGNLNLWYTTEKHWT
jgi:hypothetical protein